MKSITAKSAHDASVSFSRRFLNWKKKPEDEFEEEESLNFSSYEDELKFQALDLSAKMPKKKPFSKIKKALGVLTRSKSYPHKGLGTKVVGTLFGYRRGHVHFAFQEDPNSKPGFLVELATPTSILVREMASGLVRIALECERNSDKNGGGKLLDEPIWRTYCNGKKCGYGVRRECGPEDWKVLRAVGPVTMGAGVLPAEGDAAVGSEGSGGAGDGELMYMRARFERVVGSRDSEAFYMMNPDGPGGPELSIYLLRA